MIITNDKLAEVLTNMFNVKPGPIRHGDFNKLMFLDAMVYSAGTGISISKDDIVEHGALTDKEFEEVKTELIKGGIIVEVDHPFGKEKFYKLDLTVKETIEENIQAAGDKGAA